MTHENKKRDHLAEFDLLTTVWAQERKDYDERVAAYVAELVAEIERLRRWGEDAHHVIWQKNAAIADLTEDLGKYHSCFAGSSVAWMKAQS